MTEAADAAVPRFTLVVAAELVGTFIVTAVIIGSTVLAGAVIGPLGTALAAGLSIAAAVAVAGRVSGAHLNPAVTIGLAIAARFPWRDVVTHVIAQLAGALLGAGFVVGVLTGGTGTALADAQRAGFAAGGFGAGFSPDGFGLGSVALVEAVFTAVVVGVYAATDRWVCRGDSARSVGAWGGRALVIGAAVAALTLVAQPVSTASFNPARSVAAALFGGPEWWSQVWAFVVFPLLGAVIAGLAARWASSPATRPAE